MNISSAILHIAPARLADVRAALAAMSGVEVHAVSPEGKMVVVLEDDDMEAAANKYVSLHGIPGVASVAMVYQYSDDESVDTEEVTA
ncbi:MAG: chaperone NapD [Rhodocyclales bacterium]|nr:chaperone NapD [Rhodocyclales bacterium]